MHQKTREEKSPAVRKSGGDERSGGVGGLLLLLSLQHEAGTAAPVVFPPGYCGYVEEAVE